MIDQGQFAGLVEHSKPIVGQWQSDRVSQKVYPILRTANNAQAVERNARRPAAYRVWLFPSRRSCSAWIIFSIQ
jgi:hypothetical protein